MCGKKSCEKILVKFLSSDAKLPKAQSELASGVDLVSVEECQIPAGQTKMLKTGIAIEIPPGFEGQVRSRSGLAKKGLVVANSPGTIDSDYRGEVCVLLHNNTHMAAAVCVGDRIAQLVIAKVELPLFILVDELSDTVRGEGGFGSTGVKS